MVSNFLKFSKNFRKLQRIFQRYLGMSTDCKGFQKLGSSPEISEDFNTIQGFLTDCSGFQRIKKISSHFKGLRAY